MYEHNPINFGLRFRSINKVNLSILPDLWNARDEKVTQSKWIKLARAEDRWLASQKLHLTTTSEWRYELGWTVNNSENDRTFNVQ